MTVRSFTDADKQAVADFYTRKFFLTNKDLADFFATSPRTINRILEEQGLATPVPRLQGEAYQVMQLLKEHGVTKDQLAPILHRYKEEFFSAA